MSELIKDKFRNVKFYKIKDYFRNLDFKTGNLVKLIITATTVFLLYLMLPGSNYIESNYEIGSIWSTEDLIAPFSFPVYKNENEYELETKDVIKNISPLFNNNSGNINLKDSLEILKNELPEILANAENLEKAKEGFINSESIDMFKNKLSFKLNDLEWESVYKLYKSENIADDQISFKEYLNKIIKEVNEISEKDIINYDKEKILSKKISIKNDDVKAQDIKDISEIYDREEVSGIIRLKLNEVITDSLLRTAAVKIAGSFIYENLKYNSELTNLEITNRIEKIPRTIGIVKENERVISKHDPINRFTKMKLDSYKKVRLEKIGVQDIFLQQIGKLLSIIILILVLSLFIYYVRPELFIDNQKLIIISSLILLVSFFAYLSMKLDINMPVELLILVPVASILFTIIFDSRLAFYAVTLTCFFISAIRGGDYSILFISFCGSVLAIFSERDIKNRTQIFRSFFFILIGYTFSILAINLVRIEDSQKLWLKLTFGGINAVMSPIVAYGLLIFYERFFKISTDLTLLELSDFNHPLLKELSSKAPGTFHHSIIMGNLSEAAAESINANQILARVGCYYHDVGKTLNPQYFIENQLDQNNKHNELNPSVSTKIIIAHVKDGMDLAKKYKLPKVIIDFIPMHHGTTLVSYFYDKAKNSSKDEITDFLYRYPGPKPQTKETGIVMLADAIEASTRVIEDPTPQKLENKIREVIRSRFIEGELDECDLTLKDLTKIKESFLKILIGIHHHRIKYPDKNQLELVG